MQVSVWYIVGGTVFGYVLGFLCGSSIKWYDDTLFRRLFNLLVQVCRDVLAEDEFFKVVRRFRKVSWRARSENPIHAEEE